MYIAFPVAENFKACDRCCDNVPVELVLAERDQLSIHHDRKTLQRKVPDVMSKSLCAARPTLRR